MHVTTFLCVAASFILARRLLRELCFNRQRSKVSRGDGIRDAIKGCQVTPYKNIPLTIDIREISQTNGKAKEKLKNWKRGRWWQPGLLRDFSVDPQNNSFTLTWPRGRKREFGAALLPVGWWLRRWQFAWNVQLLSTSGVEGETADLAFNFTVNCAIPVVLWASGRELDDVMARFDFVLT